MVADMTETVELDATAIDRAIARLTALLDLMDQQERRIGELRQAVRPGEAPSTRAFHDLLNRSMIRLSLRHSSFRRSVENQIEELRKTRRSYATTDRTAAHGFTTLGEDRP